jgi:lipopolysaccharide/colanic/teichoic acid biosynthesis glycosyltransferase
MVNETNKLHNNKFILKVKSGITGLCQVSGKSCLSFK